MHRGTGSWRKMVAKSPHIFSEYVRDSIIQNSGFEVGNKRATKIATGTAYVLRLTIALRSVEQEKQLRILYHVSPHKTFDGPYHVCFTLLEVTYSVNCWF